MGTYDQVALGETFAGPVLTITEGDFESLVRIGGYTHPLFTDPAFAAASPFGKSPLPGQAVLLLMGGLAEQTGRFDETTIGLLGFDGVRFAAATFPRDTIRLVIEVLAKERTPSGHRGVLVMGWRCLNADDETLVEATVRMLFRLD